MKVKHVSVGEAIDTEAEWMDEDIHELVEGGDLISSLPPTGFHKIYGIYAKKVGAAYRLMMVVEDEPEP